MALILELDLHSYFQCFLQDSEGGKRHTHELFIITQIPICHRNTTSRVLGTSGRCHYSWAGRTYLEVTGGATEILPRMVSASKIIKKVSNSYRPDTN